MVRKHYRAPHTLLLERLDLWRSDAFHRLRNSVHFNETLVKLGSEMVEPLSGHFEDLRQNSSVLADLWRTKAARGDKPSEIEVTDASQPSSTAEEVMASETVPETPRSDEATQEYVVPSQESIEEMDVDEPEVQPKRQKTAESGSSSSFGTSILESTGRTKEVLDADGLLEGAPSCLTKTAASKLQDLFKAVGTCLATVGAKKGALARTCVKTAKQGKLVCASHAKSSNSSASCFEVETPWATLRPQLQKHVFTVTFRQHPEARRHPDAKEGGVPESRSFLVEKHGAEGAFNRAKKYLFGESYATLEQLSFSEKRWLRNPIFNLAQ
eukprot:s1188_g4.t1